jgi:uncharacterized protein (DUF983 family)
VARHRCCGCEGVGRREQTNDEPRWLVIVVASVGVGQREQTDDKPSWLVVVVVGVGAGENKRMTSLGGSSSLFKLWVWVCGPARTNEQRA